MSLREYERKRDRKQTPEPFTGRGKGKQPIFVVQRHDARRLHYDFRLERNGALASWAVPKGIPLEVGERHLAVHVEDHPLDYGSFEGEIPQGQYGAGTVEIWDSGTYELVEEKRDGGLTVRLHGKKLEGLWTLVPAHLDGKEQNWLLLRKQDDGAAPAAGPRRKYAAMLATLSDPKQIPTGEGWEFEIKWDGYRIVSRVAGGEAELRTRKDQDYTERFANVAKELAKALKTPDCVVDGEVCALDGDGRPSFSAMQQAKAGTPIVYYVFDLLEADGEPMIELPLSERRERLRKLLDGRNRTVKFSEGFADGQALYQAAELPLEIAELAADTATLCALVADRCDPRLRPDAVAATLLAEAAVRSAAHLVEVNLSAVTNDERVELARELSDAATRATARVLAP